MKTTVSETSRNCYHDRIKGRRENSEDNQILQALLKLQPATCRMLSQETGIENSATARSLNNLWTGDNPRIINCFNAKCPITGVQVKFYKVNNMQLTLFL